MQAATHETFSRDDKIVVGSDRSFGIVMAGVVRADCGAQLLA